MAVCHLACSSDFASYFPGTSDLLRLHVPIPANHPGDASQGLQVRAYGFVQLFVLLQVIFLFTIKPIHIHYVELGFPRPLDSNPVPAVCTLREPFGDEDRLSDQCRYTS